MPGFVCETSLPAALRLGASSYCFPLSGSIPERVGIGESHSRNLFERHLNKPRRFMWPHVSRLLSK